MNSNISNNCKRITEPLMNGVTFIPDPSLRKEGIRKSIDSVQVQTRRGLWGFVFFLAASLISWCLADYNLIDPMLPDMQQLIEPQTFLVMVDIVLAVSTVCDLILIAGRLNEGNRPVRIWFHVGFRSVFYIFYLLSGLLPLRFFAVFAAGLLVMGFEQTVLYLYAAKTIREEKQLLSAIGR